MYLETQTDKIAKKSSPVVKFLALVLLDISSEWEIGDRKPEPCRS